METTEQPVTDSAPLSLEERIAAKFDGGGEDETPENEQQAADPTADEQTTEQPVTTQDDSEDVDFEGVQLKLPKEAATKLKSAVEGYKDYTRKTQELAENRRLVEAQARLISEQKSFEASIAPELTQYQQADAQIAQYRKLDWTSMSMEDTMKYRALFDQLKDQKEDLGKQIQAKQQAFRNQQQQYYKAMREAQEKAVKTALPTWSEKTAQATSEYLSSKGYTPEQLANIYDPVFVELAFKAQQWDSLQASKPGVTQRANTAPPIVRPGAASPQPNKQIDRMNFRKAIKNAPDASTKNALILKRLESKI